MKKIIFINVICLMLGACSLDEEILDKFTPSTTYINAEGLRGGIIGTYAYLNHPRLFKGRGYELSILAHDLIGNRPGSGGTYASSDDIIQLTNASVQIGDPWTNLYQIVDGANQAIYYGQDIAMDEALKTELLGHAYFLRAFAYLDLVKRHGGVPLRTSPTLEPSDLHVPIATRDVVLDQIIADLEEAEAGLPVFSEQSPDDFGLATKGAAQAFLAYAHLYKGNYQLCIDYCDKVIDSGEYRLLNNFKDLFNIANEGPGGMAYDEVIFAIQFTVDDRATGYGSKGSEFAGWFLPNQYPENKGVNKYFIMREFYTEATTGVHANDYRNELMSDSVPNKNNAGNPVRTWPRSDKWGNNAIAIGPYLLKYISDGAPIPRNCENDFYYIRFAEIYMLKAEALNELGDQPGAIEAFNKIRERARMADGTARTNPVDLTLNDLDNNPLLDDRQDAFRLELAQEKAVEFVGEGVRLYDLRRLTLNDGRSMWQFILEDYYPSKYTTPEYTTEAPYNNYLATKQFRERDLLWPIPINEIDANTAIETADQNPGW